MLTNFVLRVRGKVLLSGLCALLSVLVAATVMPPAAHADLPPRPGQPVDDDDDEPRPLVASILLQTTPAQSDLWSVVQWRDADATWHDVEGWRGTVVNGRTIWWVEQKDWGKTPYRWVVYQREGGPLLAISDEFALPTQQRQQLVVSVALP